MQTFGDQSMKQIKNDMEKMEQAVVKVRTWISEALCGVESDAALHLWVESIKCRSSESYLLYWNMPFIIKHF